MRNGISAVLITKNEADVIKRCIDSLAGLDDIVILDTGSSDGTPDIARGSGAHVFTGFDEKPFHFGKARTLALSYVKQRWALSIDADEVLRQGSVGAAVKAVGGRFDISGYDVIHVNRATSGGTEMPSRKLRLFRTTEFVWRYRVHEQPVPKGREARIGFLNDCFIDHLPESDKGGRRDQNLELLRLCVAEDPDYMQAWKQLGIEHVLRENWSDAIPPLEQYAKKPDAAPPHEDCAVRMFLGKCYARLGEMDRALRFFQEAHKRAPRRREPLYWAALELIRIGDPWTALDWLKGALEVEPHYMPEFSLYSHAVQGNLVQQTLEDWKQKLRDAEEAWKAGQRSA